MAEGLRLADLLPDRLDEASRHAVEALSADEEIGCMKLAWDVVGKELQEALKSALDCDLLELLAKGWAEARLLSDYADPAKHPPGERAVLELGEHELSRDVHPVVAVTVGSCPCMEIKFTFALTAHFSGLKLAVMDGHILGGSMGEAWVSAELSYSGVPLHGDADSKKLRIPGSFRFADPGVKIPALAA